MLTLSLICPVTKLKVNTGCLPQPTNNRNAAIQQTTELCKVVCLTIAQVCCLVARSNTVRIHQFVHPCKARTGWNAWAVPSNNTNPALAPTFLKGRQVCTVFGVGWCQSVTFCSPYSRQADLCSAMSGWGCYLAGEKAVHGGGGTVPKMSGVHAPMFRDFSILFQDMQTFGWWALSVPSPPFFS